LPFPDGMFAALISNSIIHHIPEPIDVMREMIRAIKQDGVIFVRDLLRPPNEAALAKLVETYAGAANAHQQQMFANSLHAALPLEEIRTLVSGLGYDPATVKQTTDRHWTWQCRR